MMNKKKGVIGILTGGGDVPGLNPAIRAVTIRALREGYQVVGIRRGWGGLIDIIRDKNADNSNNYQFLNRRDRQSCRAHRRDPSAYFAYQAEFCQEVRTSRLI